MPLPDRPRAVITGAASGLGRALALDLAGRRARILIADIDEDGAEETARLVAAAGGEAFVTRCDVSRREEVEALVGEADRTIGGVDLLANNAGVGVGGPVGDVPIDDWGWVIGINLWGVIHGCHAFIPRMKAQRAGFILNVASMAGLVSAPEMAPYNVAKAGVVALSESIRNELFDHGITVTVLCPSFFMTRIAASGRAHNARADPAMVERLMARSKIQADSVARVAIEALDAGRLYALPHRDARWIWRLLRSAPEAFYSQVLPRAVRRLR